MMRDRGSLVLACALAACGTRATTGDASPTTDASLIDAVPRPDAAPGSVRDKARTLALHLTGRPDFMIGVGNDNSGPYSHQVAIDLHYAYLNGWGDGDGWPTWNAGGEYPAIFARTAEQHAVAPWFTYYQLALELENGNPGVLTDDGRMRQYLGDWKLLLGKLATFDRPAIISVEPDFFGYFEQQVRTTGTPPTQVAAHLRFADLHDCDAEPETVVGLTHCLIDMTRAIAPKVRIGFHASRWGAWYDELDPAADIEGSAREVGAFLRALGADRTDFVAIETLDRDAGFWETSGGGATCSVTGGSRGAVYWDEANLTLPNFDQHLRWVGALTADLGLPALWWQTPLGRPATTCGGASGHWRDSRVHYFFTHTAELVDAGGAGMAFGTGAGGQTTLATDGDQLKDFAQAYRAAPIGL